MKNSGLPGKKRKVVGLHPINQMGWKIVDILSFLGFVFVDNPYEIDTVENNFSLLNIPENHPARSFQDTFYFNDSLILRTHTSNSQVRIYKKGKNEELKVITFGKVYRRDENDATHISQFTQAEGFLVKKGIVSFAYLKNILIFLLKKIFSEIDIVYRFRSSFFPFTVPSVEVDIQCFQCQRKKKCFLCKNTGWIEILGAGLINPKVLENCGYDKNYSGLAFGLGIERLLMIKYNISDIRLFLENDFSFLKQFRNV